MNQRFLLVVILFSALTVSLFTTINFFAGLPLGRDYLDVFVGVDAAYDNLEEIKLLVDTIRPYTNTLVIGSTGITHNLTKLEDACKYLYDRGMYFMIYAHPDPEQLAIQKHWIESTVPRWGEQFLGLYAYDEPGGRQLDGAEYRVLRDWSADNYTDAANQYVKELNVFLHHTIEDQMGGLDLNLYTSDYALYWFDYKASYDVVFAEFGWNYSRQMNIAFCRGAATVQGKEWGVMITWTYNQPPYLESGSQLYLDLISAYENGAKYILVFDTNKDYTHGVLTQDHILAFKKFAEYVHYFPRSAAPTANRIAYVLPKDYGYGFRGPNDKIWGLWEADEFAIDLCVDLNSLLEKFGDRLDVIYDDALDLENGYGYSQFIFWNGTTLSPQKID